MTNDFEADGDVAWPGYVDFLSTFIFVLIVFIGSLLYLMSGDIARQTIENLMKPVGKGLSEHGVPWEIKDEKIVIPLSGKVQFATNEYSIRTEQEVFLKEVGHFFLSEGVQRVVIRGLADSQKCPSDPFCNWQISANRAQEVLKFYYSCTSCGYSDLEKVRKRLVLSGQGDIESVSEGAARAK